VILEGDRSKISRTSATLDEVESELGLARLLLARFAKRLWTDKFILVLTGLLFLAIAGVVL
jgi:hypothetical protein